MKTPEELRAWLCQRHRLTPELLDAIFACDAAYDRLEREPSLHPPVAQGIDRLDQLRHARPALGRPDDEAGLGAVVLLPTPRPAALHQAVEQTENFERGLLHGLLAGVFRFFGVHRTSRKAPAGRAGNA